VRNPVPTPFPGVRGRAWSAGGSSSLGAQGSDAGLADLPPACRAQPATLSARKSPTIGIVDTLRSTLVSCAPRPMGSARGCRSPALGRRIPEATSSTPWETLPRRGAARSPAFGAARLARNARGLSRLVTDRSCPEWVPGYPRMGLPPDWLQRCGRSSSTQRKRKEGESCHP
jgi:hypothetical protein